MSEGKLIHTELMDDEGQIPAEFAEKWAAFLRHETIPFISYPYEWSFGMLKDAALLQLELVLSALDEDMILKDSSSFNVQWMGTKPIFIDIPSFERLNSGEPWVGYRQFCQLFLYPLLLQSYKDISFQSWLRGSIDGIPPEEFNNIMSLRDLIRPGIFSHVYLQARMQKQYAKTEKDVKGYLRSAGFNKHLIRANVERLRKVIRKLKWKRIESEWSDYMNAHSYDDVDHDRKVSFVRDAVMSRQWGLVWDLGCNIGTYSRIAAENSRHVVAMDADDLAVEHLYETLKADNTVSILPLIVNIADPSPNLGWKGMERKDLPLRGKPDLVLCLALIHHIVISANIPLQEFVDWVASLGSSLVIEFVTKEDPMVKTLLRNKEDIYSDYEIGYFEKTLSEAFDITDRKRLNSGTRILYFARSRS
jgi:SAM-dependent methyltransferase